MGLRGTSECNKCASGTKFFKDSYKCDADSTCKTYLEQIDGKDTGDTYDDTYRCSPCSKQGAQYYFKDGASCEKCENNSIVSADETKCTECLGIVSEDYRTCTPCPSGQYVTKPNFQPYKCEACEGYIVAPDDCKVCEFKYQYYDKTSNKCETCVGTRNTNDYTVCDPCPSGQYFDNFSQSPPQYCFDCVTKNGIVKNGGTWCEICKGIVSGETCTDCPAG